MNLKDLGQRASATLHALPGIRAIDYSLAATLVLVALAALLMLYRCVPAPLKPAAPLPPAVSAPAVRATVAQVQTEEAVAVQGLAADAHEQIASIATRAARDAERIRAAAPAAGPELSPRVADAIDRAFFDGVCKSAVYTRNPACDGRGEPTQGDHP